MGGTGLKESRWAPSSARVHSTDYRHLKGSASNPNLPAPNARKSSLEKRQVAQLVAYQKFLRTFRRLKWKSAILLFCHHRALTKQTDNWINNVNFQITSHDGRANAAETMFKADFFEFYALLERAIVHLLECYGMVISADHTTTSVPLPLGERDLNRSVYSETRTAENSIIGDSIAFHGYAHRFHANVLTALDRPANPLHTILGSGKVRQYLGIAKEFRNRWKEVEANEAADDLTTLHKSYHKVLTDLKLDELLEALLSALEQSRLLTAAQLSTAHGSKEVEMINADDDDGFDDVTMVDGEMDWS